MRESDEMAGSTHSSGAAPAGAARPRGVVFTHWPSLTTRRLAPDNMREYARRLRAYFECNQGSGGPDQVGLVYVYLDSVVKRYLTDLVAAVEAGAADPVEAVQTRALMDDLRLRNALARAERRARRLAGVGPQAPPLIVPVSLVDLINLILNLNDVDPDLFQWLAGPGGRFTYDSPKFVEAVIRLVRGAHPLLARDPVIRVDEDVKPNADGIRLLLDTYWDEVEGRGIVFFSGRYAHEDGVPGDDPINDFAVRTHFLLPKSVPGPAPPVSDDLEVLPAPELIPSTGVVRHPIAPATDAVMRKFLADIGRFGGPQYPGRRPYSQVISGAGLITTRAAVSFLPPFINLSSMVVWIDDHLKRLLHERLRHLTPEDIESVEAAHFEQDRHPDGVAVANERSALEERPSTPGPDPSAPPSPPDVYGNRLLWGCLLHAIISDPGDVYIRLVSDIVNERVVYPSAGDFVVRIWPAQEALLEPVVRARYREVIEAWADPAYAGTFFSDWVGRQPNVYRIGRSSDHENEICAAALADAKRYAALLVEWPRIRQAIDMLEFDNNLWLDQPLP